MGVTKKKMGVVENLLRLEKAIEKLEETIMKKKMKS